MIGAEHGDHVYVTPTDAEEWGDDIARGIWPIQGCGADHGEARVGGWTYRHPDSVGVAVHYPHASGAPCA